MDTASGDLATGAQGSPFDNESACLEWLWKTLYAPDGASAVCRHCRTVRRFHRVTRRRAYACDHCGAQIYPASGTFMAGSGLGMPTWFTATALVAGDDGERVAPRALATRLGVSYKTALRLRRKIDQAVAAGGPDAELVRRLLTHPGRTGAAAGEGDVAPGKASRRRDNICAAACHAFAARGLSATRIADIAQAAGVSNAIVHYYFKSKDEILLAALRWASDQTDGRLRALRDETVDPCELLRHSLELAVPTEGVLRDEYLLWLEVYARLRVHPELLPECVAMSARWTEFLRQVFEDGDRTGVFRAAAPPAELAERFVAIIDGLSYRAAVGYPELHVKRETELLLSFAAEQLGVPRERLGPG